MKFYKDHGLGQMDEKEETFEELHSFVPESIPRHQRAIHTWEEHHGEHLDGHVPDPHSNMDESCS